MATYEKLKKFASLQLPQTDEMYFQQTRKNRSAKKRAPVLKRTSTAKVMMTLREQLKKANKKMTSQGPIAEEPLHKGKTSKVMEDFIQQKEVPPWFRGTSNYQIQAFCNLWGSLRDDMEQETTYRTLLLLKEIGLKPMISSKQARELMMLSRGNDLAFLWFLMEMYYKTDKSIDKSYDVNEQLIMSGMAHLDMITTLRGLDRILPPPQLSKVELKRKKLQELQKKREERKKKRELATLQRPKVKLNDEDKKLPYFQRLVRPREFKTNLTSEQPPFQIQMGIYEKYRDPNYSVQSERNRWFANYKLNESQRITKRIIKNELDTLEIPVVEKLFLNRSLEDRMRKVEHKLSKSSIKKKTIESLCENQRSIKKLEERLEMELKVIAKENCRKYFDVDNKQRTDLQKRIAKQMEQDVEAHMNKFRKMAETTRRRLAVIMVRKDSEFEVKMFNEHDAKLLAECQDPCAKKAKIKLINMKNAKANRCELPECVLEDDMDGGDCESDCNSSQDQLTFFGIPIMKQAKKEAMKASQKMLNDDCDKAAGDHIQQALKQIQKDGRMNLQQWNSLQDITGEKEEIKQQSNISNYLQSKYVAAYDYSRSRVPHTPTPSQIFFKAPSNNLPHQFDYHKVFYHNSSMNAAQLNVRKAFVEALINDIDLLISLEDEKEKGGSKASGANAMKLKTDLLQRLHDADIPDIDAAVKQCARELWHQKLAMQNADTLAHEKREKLIPNLREHETIFAKYKRDYYDPNDKKLMVAMLKDGLDYLARDPKYVLASFPLVHNMAFLREFIYLRYGKVYTANQRASSFFLSLRIFHALDRATLLVKLPQSSALGRKLFVPYSCHPYVKRKARFIQKRFYGHIDTMHMEQSRIFWLAMRPYMCSGGPPRNTFFAYMPSRVQDISHYRVWKPTDFRNIKSLRDYRISRENPSEVPF